MDPLVSNHIGYLLCLSEVGPKARDCLLQNVTDGEIDALSSVCLNILFERLSLTDDDSDSLAKYGPIMLLMSDRGKGRGIKKSTILKNPRFVTVLLKSVRSQLITQMQLTV